MHKKSAIRKFRKCSKIEDINEESMKPLSEKRTESFKKFHQFQKYSFQSDFKKIEERIKFLMADIQNVQKKLENFYKDIGFSNTQTTEKDIYDQECLNNFDFLKTQREYSKNLDLRGGGDPGPKRLYHYAEVPESELVHRMDADGKISFEILLPESEFTQKLTDSPNINQGDFIIKVKKSHSATPPTIIKIPPQQMVSEKSTKNSENSKRSMKRRSAGQDAIQFSIQHLRNLRKNSDKKRILEKSK